MNEKILLQELEHKLKKYYLTAILGVVFAVLGFSYNTWRLEASEDNNNVRTAAFEVLTELAALEQIIYAAHYDQDRVMGSPRKGWVKVGLIYDLSSLISPAVEHQAGSLKTLWADSWDTIATARAATDELVAQIEKVREQIKLTIVSLD